MLKLGDQVCDINGNQSINDGHSHIIGLHLLAFNKNLTML